MRACCPDTLLCVSTQELEGARPIDPPSSPNTCCVASLGFASRVFEMSSVSVAMGLSRKCTASASPTGSPCVDSKRSAARRLIVDKDFGRILPAREPARTLQPEVGRGGLVVEDLLGGLVNHPLTVLPPHPNRRRPARTREHRQIDRIIRRKRAGKAPDRVVGIHSATELNGRHLKRLFRSASSHASKED